MIDCKTKMTLCKEHSYIVTIWDTRGGFKRATQMRCQHCLVPTSIVALEQLEWEASQGITLSAPKP